MAKGSTLSAKILTDKDKKIFNLIKKISDLLIENIEDINKKEEFKNDYAKLSFNRDAGAGRGGGALQRDSLCTRGTTSNSPISNRNLRWHPLISAHVQPIFSEKIKKILIVGKKSNQNLIFIIEDSFGKEVEYLAKDVHLLEKRYVVLTEHWLEHLDKLKKWDSDLWSKNQCIIPAKECCEWWDAVESYAILGLCQSVSLFGTSREKIYNSLINILKNQNVDEEITLPSINFPELNDTIFQCPLCHLNVKQNLSFFRKNNRIESWQPGWRSSKKVEGEDSSLQIVHVKPLNEMEILHNAKYARYGHRWCNISMTDHTIDETVAFMQHVVKNNLTTN